MADNELPRYYRHSGDIGDILYGCSVMRSIGHGYLLLETKVGVREAINQPKFNSIKSLLELQPYIIDVRFNTTNQPANNGVNYDFDDFRSNLYNGCSLLKAQADLFGILPDYTPWLHAPKESVAKVIINRTNRYHGKFPWRDICDDYRKDIAFVGTEREYFKMKQLVGRIDYRPTKTLLDLAAVINGAEIFMGNQSSPLAIALGLGKWCAMERYSESPNCDLPVENLYLDPYDLIQYRQYTP